ncbi:MAG: CRISPR system precrRNA processing endoribonuclease RAMP protein Cas6 [Caldilineaceae bacterium]|nr:CRISPR system precrRNA processing endoribonuclease RAMP protein Cas6 [Caldilineaceae bacterium]
MLKIPLTAHHLRFHGWARTPITFHDYTVSALRGALTSYLRAAFCPRGQQMQNDLLHQTLCPVCRLLSLENDGSIDGDIRRPYALEPLPEQPTQIEAGQPFSFGLAIYGEDELLIQFLLVAAGGMGELGVGRVQPDGARGRLEIVQIDVVNPLTGAAECVMAPGERQVRADWQSLGHAQVLARAEALAADLAAGDNLLQVDFLTPTRVMQNQHAWSKPDFFPLAKLIVQRVLDLSSQFGGGRPMLAGEPVALKRDIYPYADAVRLVANETRWWDVHGYSSRVGRKQVLGGLVGRAVYQTADWRPLLPWLLWATSTHVGKNAVKGCGMVRLRAISASRGKMV